LARFDVAEARYLVHFPSLDAMRDEFLTLIVNTEGMEGVLDYLALTAGVDVAGERLFEDSGLDSSMSPVVFEWEGAPVLVAGVLNAPAFEAYLTSILAKRGQRLEPLRTQDAWLYPVTPEVACAVAGNLLVCRYSVEGDALAGLARLLLAEAPATAMDMPGDKVSFRVIPGSPGPRTSVSWVNDLGPLAGVAHALSAYLASCTSLHGTLELGDRYRLDLTADGCRLPGGGVPNSAPEQWVPEDTVFLAQAVLPGKRLGESVSGLHRRLFELGWNRAMGTGTAWGTLPRWLECLGSEMHVAFLGFSRTVSLDRLMSPSNPADPFFAVHLQGGGTLHCDDLWNAVTGDGGPLETIKGFDAVDCSEQDVWCREFRNAKEPDRCFSVVRRGERFLVNTGVGEGSRAVQALLSLGPTLKGSLFVEQRRGTVTLTVKTRRLVRDLVNKGFPPYFLQMLSSIMEVRIAIEPTETGTRLHGEVVLR
jgi:hypothetical protein